MKRSWIAIDLHINALDDMDPDLDLGHGLAPLLDGTVVQDLVPSALIIPKAETGAIADDGATEKVVIPNLATSRP
jgi:hypothetical protein